MFNWLLNLPVLWMALVVFCAIYAVAAAIYALVTALCVGERARTFKGISPGVLPPLAILFALLVGFTAAQVWSEADLAGAAVNREASALREAVLLAAVFPKEFDAQLRELVRGHIQTAVEDEWPAMSRGEATLSLVPRQLAEALRHALTVVPASQGQIAAQRELAASLESALEARRQRILLSRSSVNWVKWCAILLQAALTLFAIALVHADHRSANRLILGIFSTSVAVAVVLIAAHSRPFAGEIYVKPAALLQVMPEAQQ